MDFEIKQIKYEEINVPKIRKQDRMPANQMVEILSTYSGEEFEKFIFEWLKFCKKEIDKNSSIYKIGGTGDKGVDIYYKNADKVIYYQAKSIIIL